MKKVIAILVIILLLVAAILASGWLAMGAEGAQALVVDNADLLTVDEEAALETKLQEISQRQGLDLVVLTVNSLEGKSAAAYADDFYDKNGYGVGPETDGAILIVAMDDREFTITTCGYGITAFTDYGLEKLEDKIQSYLSDGDYYKAFSIYAETGDSYITQAKNGKPYDDYGKQNGNPDGKEEFPWAVRTGLSGLVGLLVSWVSTRGMKGELKTVRAVNDANKYLRGDDRMVVNSIRDRDVFLYSNTTRVLVSTESHSSGNIGKGSTIHTSSSGKIHGGGTSKKF